MRATKSQKLFKEAQKYLPGGVDSPVRAYQAVGGQPLFIERGQGAWVFDVDGNRYIDYVLSWGPLILGMTTSVSMRWMNPVCCSDMRSASPGLGASRIL